MGAYGVSVEKEFTFRGQAERTSNNYHYRITAPVPVDYETLADAVVLRDKAAHVPTFTYKTVRVWGPTEGSKADNLMRLVKDISGAGTRAALGANLYPELTVVTQMYVGRSPVKNRKVYVRKYVHAIAGANSGGIDQTSALLSAAEKTFWKGWVESLKTVTNNAVSYSMVTPVDRLVPNDAVGEVLNYAHIRQLKQ